MYNLKDHGSTTFRYNNFFLEKQPPGNDDSDVIKENDLTFPIEGGGRRPSQATGCPWIREGLCSLPHCWKADEGTVEVFLTSCPSLSHTRMELEQYNSSFLQANPSLAHLVNRCLDPDRVQLSLYCSTMTPGLFKAKQNLLSE